MHPELSPHTRDAIFGGPNGGRFAALDIAPATSSEGQVLNPDLVSAVSELRSFARGMQRDLITFYLGRVDLNTVAVESTSLDAKDFSEPETLGTKYVELKGQRKGEGHEGEYIILGGYRLDTQEPEVTAVVWDGDTWSDDLEEGYVHEVGGKEDEVKITRNAFGLGDDNVRRGSLGDEFLEYLSENTQ